MSAEPTTLLDPEIEELLRQIARDPRSTLLRVTRPQIAKGLFERSPAVGARAAGLTAAERQLLCVHREETALMLRQLFYHRFLRDERMRRMTWMHGAGELGTESDLSRRLSASTEADGSDGTDSWSAHVVADALAVPPDAAASPSQIALAALRLVPSDNARNFLGYQLVRTGNLRSALRVFEGVARTSRRRRSVVSALSWSGIALGLLGEPRQALGMYATKVARPEEWPNKAMSRLTFSVQVGDVHEAVRAAAEVDEFWSAGNAHISAWIQDRIQLRGVTWSPSKAALDSIVLLSDRVGATSRRVLDVFR